MIPEPHPPGKQLLPIRGRFRKRRIKHAKAVACSTCPDTRLLRHTISCISVPKPVEFRGSSLDNLRAFPLPARREAGHQLDQVQNGQEPDDWKPMNTVGQGAKEIRIRDAAGTFRVIYVAKFADAVYVLHCFQKKTEKTSKADLDLASKRYRDLLRS
jgi:phage-related protein